MAHKNTSGRAALVTGGAGFIGSHLCQRLLSAGRRVVVLDNFNDYYDPALKRENIELLREADPGGLLTVVEGDMRDAALVRRVFTDHEIGSVFHFGAMAGVRASIQKPALYFDVNINGTVNIIDAAAAHGAERLIFASSSSVYGGSPRIPFREDDPADRPVSPYAASKKAGELLCHTWHHLHRLPVVCLRFFTVYGPRQRPEMAVHLFSEKIVSGRSAPMFGDGSTSRDYTYIDDIIDGVLAAERHCEGYRIYNLGDNKPVQLADMVAALGKALGEKPRIEQLPLPPGDVLRTWADISRAEKDLGYRPSVDIEEGLRRFAEWFLARRRERGESN